MYNQEVERSPLAKPYQDLQKAIRLAQRIPPSVGFPQNLHHADMSRLDYIQGFQAFCEKLPPDMVDVLTAYPHRIPELDLSGRVGSTGHIDFLTASDLSAPVMRGIDRLSRPFFAVRVVNEGSRETREHTQAFFQRYTSDSKDWRASRRNLGITDVDFNQSPKAWKAVMTKLLSAGETTETLRFNGHEHTDQLRLHRGVGGSLDKRHDVTGW